MVAANGLSLARRTARPTAARDRFGRSRRRRGTISAAVC